MAGVSDAVLNNEEHNLNLTNTTNNLSDSSPSPVDDSDADKDYYPASDSSADNSETELITQEKRDAKKRPRPTSPSETPKGRWRRNNNENYSRVKRKKRRNLGQEYVSDSTKKTVKARVIGFPCSCKQRCRDKLQGKEEAIFNGFWDLGSFDLQNSYLFGCVKVGKKKRTYYTKLKNVESRRKVTADYFVNVNSTAVKICKTEFLSVHGLQNSRGRINNVVKQLTNGASTPKTDERGKHSNRPNALSDKQRESVRMHINRIPKYQSHYSRANNLGKVYLNYDMSIARLYNDFYIPWCREENIKPVTQDAYRRIFCTEYNIGFKLPKSDTCKTCDELSIKIENNEIDTEVIMLTTELNVHKMKAEGMQKLLQQETELSKENSKKLVITFDLQQALPIPKLTTGPAFYCHKIWLYNLGIHDCTHDQGHMFLWTEDIAKRGSEEIASALLKYLKDVSGVDELVIFTDNCPGQNKNWTIMSLWSQFIKEKRFKSITHNFLISGHTHLASDRDFALIEKHHRKYFMQVYSPSQWEEIIRHSNKKTPFRVHAMKQEDFYSFQQVMQNMKKATHTNEGQPLDFSATYSFHFNEDSPGSMYVKHSVNGPYIKVNISKKGRPGLSTLSAVPRKYKNPLNIPKKKLATVKTLLPYIPPIHHHFYNGLVSANDAEDEENGEAELL